MTLDWRAIVAAGVCTEADAAQLAGHLDLDGNGAWHFRKQHRMSAHLRHVQERIVEFLELEAREEGE